MANDRESPGETGENLAAGGSGGVSPRLMAPPGRRAYRWRAEDVADLRVGEKRKHWYAVPGVCPPLDMFAVVEVLEEPRAVRMVSDGHESTVHHVLVRWPGGDVVDTYVQFLVPPND